LLFKENLRLGELLVKNDIISDKQLEQALSQHQKVGEFLGRTVVKMGIASEEEVLPLLSKKLKIPYVQINKLSIPPEVIKKVPAKFACHYELIPIKLEGKVLTVALSDPSSLEFIDDLTLLLGYKINPMLAGELDIMKGLKKYYGIGAETIEEMMKQTSQTGTMKKIESSVDDIEELAADATIIKFVNQILLEAYRDRATDIHIEPYEDELRIRYRIDGILHEAKVPKSVKHFREALVSRIKIMASLNIAERRMPQDGRIKVKIGKVDLDLRISVLPTPFGESVNIRLLSSDIFLGLGTLGLSSRHLEILESVIHKPHGVILLTGPTGSGKTTTLYACLSEINDSKKKIITIEDPIEYQLNGISQIQVLPKIDLTFARGLRSMLRHDPDIMMVGEIRDFETAETTIRTALTGHLVFSTLHTNDAAGAMTRLLDMGVEAYLLASSLECVIAQRLLRVICEDCKEVAENSAVQKKSLGIPNETKIFIGKGCEKCRFTGFKGRTAIHEILVINDEIRELIVKRTSANIIRDKAILQGMKTLRQDGLDKVCKGITTIEEVLRVTQQEER